MTKATPEKKNKSSRPAPASRVVKAAQGPAPSLKSRAEALGKSIKGQRSVLASIQDLAPELLAAGQLDAPIFSSDTAISFACGRGDFQAVDFLIGIGASAKAPTRYGQSALMQAVGSLSPNDASHAVDWERAQACMELVVAAGCDIHHRNQIGQQAINWASWAPKRLEAVRWLLARGANPSAACDDGKTPLHHAAMSGNIEAARIFLDAGADPESLAKYSVDSNLVDPSEVALIWQGFHHNSELVALLAAAKSFAQAQRAAEKERQELGSAAASSAAARPTPAPRI